MSTRFLLTAALSVLACGTALADQTLVATLANPTLKQEQILGGTLWRCAETTCRSASQPRDTGISACRALVKRFGQVASFGSGDKQLDDKQLASCNESAK